MFTSILTSIVLVSGFGLFQLFSPSKTTAGDLVETDRESAEHAVQISENKQRSTGKLQAYPDEMLDNIYVKHNVYPGSATDQPPSRFEATRSLNGGAKTPLQPKASPKLPQKEVALSETAAPGTAMAHQSATIDSKQISHRITHTIQKGDNMASIFKKYQLDRKLLHQLVQDTKHGKQLQRIKPGQIIHFEFDSKHQPVKILLQKNQLESLVISKDDSGQYLSSIDVKEVEIRQRFVNVVIKDSLFAAATRAGLSDKFTMRLAELFGWDIDFALDIRRGDSFSVLFEEKYLDGKKIDYGNILAAEFINQNKVYQTVRFTDASGKSDYYSPDGYSKRKAFIRTPVDFTRISSRFSAGRKHPVLNRIRAHRGVDYAAPRGTPIKAAGDGKVVFRGRKGGYGKVIQIQHGSKYMTVYAHMSSFHRKIKRGSTVKQGQIIGYVGSTGLATGPHLHYEFRVNGVHRNPLTVKLPKANPVPRKYRQQFLAHSENILSYLKIQKQQALALNKN